MRKVVIVILLLTALHPMLSSSELDNSPLEVQFTGASGVEVINEVEPNNVNTSGQEVYPGDVVRGTVDMWDDKHDWFKIWLEPSQTMLLTLSHASGDGVSMSVWDEENTHLGVSNPSKTSDTIFLGEDETDMGGAYSVSINSTMTEVGGGAYVLEIDAGYQVQWYSPEVGWYAASEQYNAKGELMYTSSLSSYKFDNENTTNKQSAPVWENGDYWNFSVSMPEFFGTTYEEYHQMTVTGSDIVSGKQCYTVSIVGKATLNMNLMGMTTTTVDEQSGVACYAKDTLSMVHENLTFTNSIESSGGAFGAMSTSGREGCTDDFGDPDEDCDNVGDDFDDCAGTASGAEVDGFGCSDAQNGGGGDNGGGSDDTDGDGIPDSNDACPNEASTAENDADSDGCPDDNGGGGDGGDGSGSGTADADNDGVSDDEDDCPNTPAGESVDFFGCSDSQNGGGDGSGDGSGNNGGGFGGLDDICIPSGTDMSQKTVINSDLTYANGMNNFNFPLTEGKVWSEAAVGSGTISLSIEMGGCTISTMDIQDSGALPLNYRHLGDQSFTIGQSSVTATGIQVFAGRQGNDDWATPDFTLLQSVPDDVAKMGLPFAAWVNVVGFNEFASIVNLSASINPSNAPLTFNSTQLTVDELGAVIVDTMNLDSGDYIITITGTSNGMDRSITVPFTVDNDPDFDIVTLDPWIVIPQGVEWVVPTPIFIEPINGFSGADVTIGVTVPDGVTAQLDFSQGTAPFLSVLTLTIPSNLSAGDYTVIVTGTAGSTVHSDEITFTLTSMPEFSLEVENREQIIEDGTMSISGVIDAHNGLDLALGGALDVLIEPYNQELLDSVVITWGTIDSNGDLPFTVTFTVDESIPRNQYTINLNVVSLDGGLAHSASVAFVTESSTLDGTAVAADSSAVSSGNTSQHDGTDSSATTIAGEESNDDSKDDDSESDSKSSNTAIIIGSTIGVLGIIAGVAVVVLRSRTGANKDFAQPMWNEQSGMMNQMPVAGAPQMMQQPMQPVQQMQQIPQQTMQDMAQPVQPQPVQPVAQAPVPQMATAPPPPAQPTTVADYTGLPAGGQYDQSTGQTIYILPDGARWQMMGDGSFNRL
jgi:hypothetical protein